MRALLVVALLALSGCIADEPDSTSTTPEDRDGAVLEPYDLTLYVNPDFTLSENATEGRHTIDWGYQQWLEGVPADAWTGLPGPMHILHAELTLFYEATKPAVGGPARPELTAWWGTDTTYVHHVFMDGGDALQPGEQVEVSQELRMPEGGLVISPNNVMEIRIGSYYVDGPNADVMELLMGAGTPSRIDMLVQPIQWPETTSEVMLDTTGSVLGGRCTAFNPADMANSIHTINVPNGTAGIEVRVESIEATGSHDIDLVVLGPNGEDVGGGHGSFNVEGADIWMPQLDVAGPGEYAIIVFACTPQSSTYSIDVTVYEHA